MEARIETLAEKKLVGKKRVMSIASNRTFDLWRNFMPRKKEIINCMSANLFSMQVYEKSLDYFKNFNPDTEFTKWAALEVSDFDKVPDNMETYLLPGGLYAVFMYKGTSDKFDKAFRYIFETWLPNSNFVLDNREHFEILGEKYKLNDPNSEEEIWVPIKPKD